MIVIAAASLLPNPKLASLPANVTPVPSDTVELARATSATLLTTLVDASKSALFPHCHRIEPHFRFRLRCARASWLSPRKRNASL